MDQETVVPRETFSLQDRVAETPRSRLINPDQSRIVNHSIESLQILGSTVQTPPVKLRNERGVRCEMILDSSLSSPYDETEFPEPDSVQLLEYQLNDGLQTQISFRPSGEDR